MTDEAHVPVYELDQLAAGVLEQEKATQVSAHLGSCPGCSARLQEIRVAQEAELASHPPIAFAAKIAARRRTFGPRLTWATGLIPAAAAVLLVVVLLRPGPEAILQKGSARVVLQAKLPGASRLSPVKDEEAWPSGTELRLSVLPGSYERVAIFTVDAQGNVAEVATVASGAQIPAGLLIDDSPEPDRVFAVFSEEARDSSEPR